MTPARFSVVVPAHNEAAVIGRCLDAFVPALHEGEAEIIVVVNGSTDATAQVASAFPGVTVLETAAAGKAHALNLGDAAATAFPRVYLDADIVVSTDALRDLVATLPPGEPRLGSLHLSVNLDRSSLPVRMFYAVFLQMPYAQDSFGVGLYALSGAGRSRFDEFPSITGDDLFVHRLFSAQEMRRVDHAFVIHAPRDLRSLVQVRTRIHFGNHEATVVLGPERFGSTAAPSGQALLSIAFRRPSLLPHFVVYVAVTAFARARARAQARRGAVMWQRDESTR